MVMSEKIVATAILWLMVLRAEQSDRFREDVYVLRSGYLSGPSSTTIENATAASASQCAMFCTSNPACDGADYHASSRTCATVSYDGRLPKLQLTNQQWILIVKRKILSQDKSIYPVTYIAGARWRPFWWFKAGTAWPVNVTDVLQDEYGTCDPLFAYCFGRLPANLKEDLSELLGEDSDNNVYRWQFDSTNSVAHATWRALHDRETVRLANSDKWMPETVKGSAPSANQDSVQYRKEHGVMSLMIDDDGCDCKSSLSIGHGMCGAGFNSQYGVENSYGADLLYDPGCNSPSNSNGLTLYFKDDDDCANVTCPQGKSCRDDIYSHTCE